MSAAVLLTGFPGFLGSALLDRLLARGDGPVACLVQPAYAAEARRRADAICADHDCDADEAVRLLEGDITDPGLGLGTDPATVDALDDVREVYHLAAIYDLGVDPGPAEAVNVRGTEHILDAAEALGVERVQYVSTCYVSGRYDGVFTGDHLVEGQTFNNHYEETKYRAEVAVQERMEQGLSATIYRPAIVVGDSETGVTDKYDGPYYLLRLLLAQPRWLSVMFLPPGARDAEFNVVPRDFVVDAIAHLSDRSDTAGEVYQLCDPSPLPVPSFVQALADAVGHRTVTVPTSRRLGRRVTGAFADRGFPIEPAAFDYLDHPARYAAPNTRRALAGTDVAVPALESYVDTLVAFVREHPEVGSDAMA